MNYLIQAAELAERLDDSNLRIFDSAVHLVPAKNGYKAQSGREKYLEARVPGAAFLDLIQDLSDTTTGLGFSLPTPDALANAVGAAGVSNHNEVVLYSSGHTMWATRAWWLLRYLGHENVRVLNGGLKAWQAAGGEIHSGDATYSASEYQANPQPQLFVDLDGMTAASESNVCTINALSRDFYTGEGEANYGRPGHIPGSGHLFYDELLDDGSFRPMEELRAVLNKHGLLSAERVITYCGGGIAATVDGFACDQLGYENIAVYDDSMSQWAKDESLPIETG